MSNNESNETKDKKFPCYINERHIHEIDDVVSKKKRAGERGNSGKPYNRNDYIREALKIHAEKTGLKTEP